MVILCLTFRRNTEPSFPHLLLSAVMLSFKTVFSLLLEQGRRVSRVAHSAILILEVRAKLTFCITRAPEEGLVFPHSDPSCPSKNWGCMLTVEGEGRTEGHTHPGCTRPSPTGTLEDIRASSLIYFYLKSKKK